MSRFLVTGAAGFVGHALCQRLLADGHEVVGLDNLVPYYDVRLKEARLARLKPHAGFRFVFVDLADRSAMATLFAENRFDIVVNLAAQAGVRYSIENPHAYVDSNLVGFVNVLEGCRHNEVKHLVYASSSSVYGLNAAMPFSVGDNVDHPMSLYAATKKSNELMAHTYSHLFGLPTTGLRFFTVYGPWGRPDMAAYLFTDAIAKGKPINVYGEGKLRRDFTYIDDIIEGVVRVCHRTAAPDPNWDPRHPAPGTSNAPYRIYNIGNNNPTTVNELIGYIETELGQKAVRNLMPMQPGDVEATYANVDDLVRDVGFRPATRLEDGLRNFVRWYCEYTGWSP
jgi:UDP-glucuronate 4-epimerase